MTSLIPDKISDEGLNSLIEMLRATVATNRLLRVVADDKAAQLLSALMELQNHRTTDKRVAWHAQSQASRIAHLEDELANAVCAVEKLSDCVHNLHSELDYYRKRYDDVNGVPAYWDSNPYENLTFRRDDDEC